MELLRLLLLLLGLGTLESWLEDGDTHVGFHYYDWSGRVSDSVRSIFPKICHVHDVSLLGLFIHSLQVLEVHPGPTKDVVVL